MSHEGNVMGRLHKFEPTVSLTLLIPFVEVIEVGRLAIEVAEVLR
jgi:hypothetical protein